MWQVSKRGLEAIASLEKLQRLDLVSSLVLEPEALYPLSRLQQLRHLDVGNFQYITNEVLEVRRCLLLLYSAPSMISCFAVALACV